MMGLTIGAKIEHPSKGEGVIFGETDQAWRVYFQEGGEEKIGKSYDGLELLEAGEGNSDIGIEEVVLAVQNVFDQYYESDKVIELGDKWEGGTMILQPGNTDLKTKEIPIETFFHKIVMVRDRLRVLEQSVNAHKILTDEEKVHLQQYITRIYGSLTTFNALFGSKDDYFTGQSASSS